MKILAIGAGAVLVFGGAAYAQYSLNQMVDHELAGLSDSQRLSQQIGAPVTVDVRSQNHGLLNSSGSLSIRGDFPDGGSVQSVIDYQVDHSILSGVRYEFVLPEFVVHSDERISLNEVMFQGEPIRITGDLDAEGSQGQILIPAVRGEDQDGTVVSIDAFPIHVTAHGFDENALMGDYAMDAMIPQIQIQQLNGQVVIENVRWAQHYLGNDDVTQADMTLSVGHVESQGGGMATRFELNNATLNVDTDISEQASSNMELTLVSATSMMGAVSDLSLKTHTGGFDGSTLKAWLLKIDQLEQSADPEAVVADLEAYFTRHIDALLAPSPYFQIEQMQFDMNGQRFVEASGKITLQTDKLPNGYFASLLNQQAALDEEVLLSAVDISLDTSFGAQAAMMIGPMHPMLMGVLQSGQPLSFKMQNGQMILNGQPL